MSNVSLDFIAEILQQVQAEQREIRTEQRVMQLALKEFREYVHGEFEVIRSDHERRIRTLEG